jgi:hypothetical protein
VPILVRPVREQIEHDRVIRQLQAKWGRKFRVEANPGDERSATVKVGETQLFPDVVLTAEGAKKPTAIVEVESAESVNHLEAMSQWATFARSRIPFYLFVPGPALDAARRLCADHQVELAELWTYLVLGDQIRFTSIFRSSSSPDTSVEDIGEAVERSGKAERAEKSRKPSDRTEAAAPAKRPQSARTPAPRPVVASPRRKAATPAAPRRKARAPTKRATAPKRAGTRTSTAKRGPVRRAVAAAKARPASKRTQKRK